MISFLALAGCEVIEEGVDKTLVGCCVNIEEEDKLTDGEPLNKSSSCPIGFLVLFSVIFGASCFFLVAGFTSIAAIF